MRISGLIAAVGAGALCFPAIASAADTDLRVTAQPSIYPTAILGQGIAPQFEVMNDGPAASTGSTLAVAISPELRYVDLGLGFDSRCKATGPTTVACAVGPLEPRERTSVSIAASAQKLAKPATFIARIVGQEPDPNPSNDSASSQVTVVPGVIQPNYKAAKIKVLTLRGDKRCATVPRKGPLTIGFRTTLNRRAPLRVAVQKRTSGPAYRTCPKPGTSTAGRFRTIQEAQFESMLDPADTGTDRRRVKLKVNVAPGLYRVVVSATDFTGQALPKATYLRVTRR